MFLENRLCWKKNFFSSVLAEATSATHEKNNEVKPTSLLQMAKKARIKENEKNKIKKKLKKLATKIKIPKKSKKIKKREKNEKEKKEEENFLLNIKIIQKNKNNRVFLKSFIPKNNLSKKNESRLKLLIIKLLEKDRERRFKEKLKNKNNSDKRGKISALAKEMKEIDKMSPPKGICLLNSLKKVKKGNEIIKKVNKKFQKVRKNGNRYKKELSNKIQKPASKSPIGPHVSPNIENKVKFIDNDIAKTECQKSVGAENNKELVSAITGENIDKETIAKQQQEFINYQKKKQKTTIRTLNSKINDYKEQVNKANKIINAAKNLKEKDILKDIKGKDILKNIKVKVNNAKLVKQHSLEVIKDLEKARQEVKKEPISNINYYILSKINNTNTKVIDKNIENFIRNKYKNLSEEEEIIKKIEHAKKIFRHEKIEFNKRHRSPIVTLKIKALVRKKRITSDKSLSQEELKKYEEEISQDFLFNSLGEEEQKFILSDSYLKDVQEIEREKAPLYEKEYKNLYKSLNEKEKGELITLLDLEKSNNPNDKILLQKMKAIEKISGNKTGFYRDKEGNAYANIHGIRLSIPNEKNKSYVINLPNGGTKECKSLKDAEPIIEKILAHQIFQVLHMNKFFKGQEKYKRPFIQMCLDGGGNPLLRKSEKIENNENNNIIFDPLTARQKTAYYLSALGANFTPQKSNIPSNTKAIPYLSGNSLSDKSIKNLKNIGFLGKNGLFNPKGMQFPQQLISFIHNELNEDTDIRNMKDLTYKIENYVKNNNNSSFLKKIDENTYAINMTNNTKNKQIVSIENDEILLG